MRISDWSSDVCSSDLERPAVLPPRLWHGRRAGRCRLFAATRSQRGAAGAVAQQAGMDDGAGAGRRARRPRQGRSEEHTSELQSLMRISYPVFCLKKNYSIILTMKTTYTINLHIHTDQQSNTISYDTL